MTITGETLGERLAAEEGAYVDRRVIKSAAEPLEPQGGLVALFGSLAPDGAIIKRSAATPALFEKTGRAVVFSSLEDLAARIDDPKLDVTADDFLILQNAGPRSAVRHAGGGLPADPQEAAGGGREGHGAHVGCAHVGHRLRHHHPAHRAGGRGRRAAGAGARRATGSGCP